VNSGVGSALRTFVLPAGVVLLGLITLLQIGVLNVPNNQVADFYWYVAFGVGALLAWRFHSMRVLFSLAALAIASKAPEALPGEAVVSAIAILLPLNLVAFSLLDERGFTWPEFGLRGGFFFLQFVLIALLTRPELSEVAKFMDARILPRVALHIPQFALVTLIFAASIFALRFMLSPRPVEAGFFWSMGAVLLGLNSPAPHSTFYLATAGLLISTSVVENSYRMAYHDELTGLPARRAFNDALYRLGERYSIAVLDIDHFKRFNDEFGHETGDQVLRMVSSKLARVGSGGMSFRFGGEEFIILFPGKSTREVMLELDHLRDEIANSLFVIRGFDRPGPTPVRKTERRSLGDTAVTVSIGVASRTDGMREVEAVMRAADKAMYRAKRNGRNRVESFHTAAAAARSAETFR
jgi:diguanylate cyclase (GGDEF)-like protein